MLNMMRKMCIMVKVGEANKKRKRMEIGKFLNFAEIGGYAIGF